MTATAIALYLLLAALVTRMDGLPVIVDPEDEYGRASCYGGVPVVYLPVAPLIQAIVHEYLHAYDCADNGFMDGSPVGSPEVRDPAHLWVYWALYYPEDATRIVKGEGH
jgi:hypothetical protein